MCEYLFFGRSVLFLSRFLSVLNCLLPFCKVLVTIRSTPTNERFSVYFSEHLILQIPIDKIINIIFYHNHICNSIFIPLKFIKNLIHLFQKCRLSFDPIGTHPIPSKFHNVNGRFCGAIHSVNWACISVLSQVIHNVNKRKNGADKYDSLCEPWRQDSSEAYRNA